MDAGAEGRGQFPRGIICAEKPDRLWGKDGTTALVVEEGTVWIFGAIEHSNAECVGTPAYKIGDRFNAVEPVKQGLWKHYGSRAKGIVTGLPLRCDHGGQCTSDHFQIEPKHFGIRQSLAQVRDPETKGVIERFCMTWKKQVLEGRIYQPLADLRKTMREFVDLYNRRWRLEKFGGHTPDEVRQTWLTNQAA